MTRMPARTTPAARPIAVPRKSSERVITAAPYVFARPLTLACPRWETKTGAARQEQRPFDIEVFDLYSGFGTIQTLLVSLWPHVAQRPGLLLLAIDLAIHSAKCGSDNDANNSPGRCLALGVHYGSPEV